MVAGQFSKLQDVISKLKVDKFLLTSTVPATKFLLGGTVPATKFLLAGTVPATKFLLAGTVHYLFKLRLEASIPRSVCLSCLSVCLSCPVLSCHKTSPPRLARPSQDTHVRPHNYKTQYWCTLSRITGQSKVRAPPASMKLLYHAQFETSF
jgi:hypothetical protein